ncbi:MAG: hypothetical protein COA73_00390 [Candidatus Hydrogenedentota bacterium]|nr:MAG: hypothetical protein COA73_00390 [Candidatus Hydrogenedentota bacterium]
MSEESIGITAIVLAAGDSTRMGSQKLLLPFGGKTVVEHIVDTLLDTRVSSIIVVTGRDGERIGEVLGNRDVSIVPNPDPDRGMLSSVRIGVEKMTTNDNAFMVLLGDQPAIQLDVVEALLQDFEKDKKGICVPNYDGRRGHPILISMEFKDAVLNRYDDSGLRGLLREHSEMVRDVTVREAWILDDMDYPEDYERELRRLGET